MSYLDEDDPIPPTVVESILAAADREKGFVFDLLLLVAVALALSTGLGIWPFIGLAALMTHVVMVYREK